MILNFSPFRLMDLTSLSTMEKKEYIKQRKQGLIDIENVWEMYLNVEHENKPDIPFNIFVQIFPIWLQMSNSNMEYYWNYYDRKFEIEVLYDKNNKIILIK